MSSFNRSRTTAAKVTLSIKIYEEGEEDDGQNQKKQDEETQMSGFSVLDLPSIAIDIISRLPIRTIFQCRCVFESWRNLIFDPYFSIKYLMRPHAISVVLSVKGSFYLLELGEDYEYTCWQNKPIRLDTQLNLPAKTLDIVGSTNGLLLFSDSGGNCPLYITNPILGEYALLPVPKRKKKVLRVASGFGFVPASGKYKLLRAVLKRDRGYHPKSDGEVCTLGTNIWRKLGDMPFPLHGKLCSANLHGSLNWIADDFPKSQFIFSFDLENEQVRAIPPPALFGPKTIWMSLGVLGDCLCIFDNLRYSHLVIWKMKHFGIAESWTRDIILKTSFPSMLPTRWLRPVTNWRDGEILIKCGTGPLVSYNPISGNFEKVAVSGFEWVFSSVVSVTPITFAPSFSSLKDAVMCEGLMRVKIQSI